jgi:hypothetical protein
VKFLDYYEISGRRFDTARRCLPENQDYNYSLADYVHVLEGQHPEWKQYESQDLNQSIVQKAYEFANNAYAK